MERRRPTTTVAEPPPDDLASVDSVMHARSQLEADVPIGGDLPSDDLTAAR